MARALTKRWNTRVATIVVGLTAILVVYQPLQNVITQNRLFTMVDTRATAKQWIEANIPTGSKIALQWYSPPLATVDDPEPDSSRTYFTEVIDPFDANPQLYNLDAYRAKGFDYLVISSFVYRLARVDALDNQQRTDFYRSLDTDARLLAEFKPVKGDGEIDFMFEEIWSPIVSLLQRDQPGPTIRIYRIGNE